jgi:hypothetical protein
MIALVVAGISAACSSSPNDDLYDVADVPATRGSGDSGAAGGSGGATAGAGPSGATTGVGPGAGAGGGASGAGGGTSGAGGGAGDVLGGCECVVEASATPGSLCGTCLYDLLQAGNCATIATECFSDTGCQQIINNQLKNCPNGAVALCWGQIISGGTFSAQSIALASDFLDCSCTGCIGVTSCLGNKTCPL